MKAQLLIFSFIYPTVERRRWPVWLRWSFPNSRSRRVTFTTFRNIKCGYYSAWWVTPGYSSFISSILYLYFSSLPADFFVEQTQLSHFFSCCNNIPLGNNSIKKTHPLVMNSVLVVHVLFTKQNKEKKKIQVVLQTQILKKNQNKTTNKLQEIIMLMIYLHPTSISKNQS